MRRNSAKALLLASSVLASMIVLTACGGGGSTSSGSTQGTSSNPEKTSSGGVETAKLEKILAPYIGQPSPFPVIEKLKEVPKGATVDFMDCGSPFCSLFYELLTPAAATLGVKLERIKSGSAANTVSAAYDSVVAKEPDAVIAMATPISLWSKQLKELEAAGIPVVGEGISAPESEQYGLPTGPAGSVKAAEHTAELLAAYVAAKMTPEANVAVYQSPEVGVLTEIAEEFEADLAEYCPECSARMVAIPLEAIGNTAPSEIVSDLQAHPDTNVLVFTASEVSAGLPAALKTAGIEVETLGSGPTPTNLQYLKENKETVGFAEDLPVLAWTLMDQVARAIVGQKLTGLQAEGTDDVRQFLTPKDITFDPSKGWTGYPNFPELFAKIWGVEG